MSRGGKPPSGGCSSSCRESPALPEELKLFSVRWSTIIYVWKVRPSHLLQSNPREWPTYLEVLYKPYLFALYDIMCFLRHDRSYNPGAPVWGVLWCETKQREEQEPLVLQQIWQLLRSGWGKITPLRENSTSVFQESFTQRWKKIACKLFWEQNIAHKQCIPKAHAVYVFAIHAGICIDTSDDSILFNIYTIWWWGTWMEFNRCVKTWQQKVCSPTLNIQRASYQGW